MSKARELAELGAVYDSGALSNRNIIINGAMMVAQRATSHSTAGYGSLDRFSLALSGGTATMSQQSMSSSDRTTTGFDKYLRINTTSGNNNAGLYYKIEANDIIFALNKKLTLSFWAKGTNPGAGQYTFQHYWYDGSNQDNGTSQNLTITSTWTKYSITFDTATVSSADLTLATSRYDIAILQDSGDTSTAAWDLNITGYQLELGTEATPFEHRSFGDELARCHRYFEKEIPTWGTPRSTDNVIHSSGYFKVQKRASPTMTLVNDTYSNSPAIQQVNTSYYVTYDAASANSSLNATYNADAEL